MIPESVVFLQLVRSVNNGFVYATEKKNKKNYRGKIAYHVTDVRCCCLKSA